MFVYKRILLIDDDLDDQEFFTNAVNELNAELTCIVAANGKEGLIKTKVPPPPDVIFVDINMPVMNGFEFLEKIKKESAYRHIPKVMLSTSNNLADKLKAKQLGAVDYIVKPSTFNLLKKQLNELLTSQLV